MSPDVASTKTGIYSSLQNRYNVFKAWRSPLHSFQNIFYLPVTKAKGMQGSDWLHFFSFDRVSLCVALTVLERTLYARLVSNSYRSACHCLPRAETKGVHHQHPANTFLLAELVVSLHGGWWRRLEASEAGAKGLGMILMKKRINYCLFKWQ